MFLPVWFRGNVVCRRCIRLLGEGPRRLGLTSKVDRNKVLQPAQAIRIGGVQHRKRRAYTIGCGGLPPRQVVCTFTSASEEGGPLDVYVGVNEGNQKSGSLLRRAAACSRSICRRAASSASCTTFSAVVESNANLRLIPRPDKSGLSVDDRNKKGGPCYLAPRCQGL